MGKAKQAIKAKKAAAKAAPVVNRVPEYLKAQREKEALDTYTMQPGAAQACKPRYIGGKQTKDIDVGVFCDNMKRGSYGRPMPLAPVHLDPENHKRVMMEGNTKLADLNVASVATIYKGAEVQKIVHTPKQAELRRPFKAVGVFGTNAKSQQLGKFLSETGNAAKEIKENAIWAEPMKLAKSAGKRYNTILNNKKLTEKQRSVALRELVERSNVSDKKGAKVRTSPAAGQKVFEGLMAQEGVSLERERPILHLANKYK